MKIPSKTLKTMPIAVLALAILAGCGKQQSQTPPPGVGLHEAVIQGDLEAIRQHIAAGSDLNQKEPLGGASPLIAAAAFGQTAAVRALIEAGADVNTRNNEGSTPLHTAAFLCHTEIVEVLLANGAEKAARNNAGATALESVAGPFDEVKGIYDLLSGVLGPAGLELDYERIKATRPKIAEVLR